MYREKALPNSERPRPMSRLAAVSAMPHPLLVEHALKRYTILNRWMSRAVNNSIASAKLAPLATHPQVWETIFRLQQAVLEQVQEQQLDWLHGWEAWLAELAQIKRVNTLSKLVEQEFNLAAQLVVFFQERATDLVKLQENVQVNYGYWINEQLGSPTETTVIG